MRSNDSLRDEIIDHVETTYGVKAGVASLPAVLDGASYRADAEDWMPTTGSKEGSTEWPPEAESVLVLGMAHSESEPYLDWWKRGNTPGNRLLMDISDKVIAWMGERYNIGAVQLPYYVERGGLFLKDAAVLAGLGIVGKNNLFLHPEWGPRIRLRAILIEADLKPTTLTENFSPCDPCEQFCRKACPEKAFPGGVYSRARCSRQIQWNADHPVPEPGREKGEKAEMVIQYCRACELACPVGGG